MPTRKTIIKTLEGYKNHAFGDKDGKCTVADILELLKERKPKHIHEEYAEHDWKKDKDGKIDLWAMDCDYHNGPVCQRCYYSFCIHCEPDGYNKEHCVVDEYVCPTCGRLLFYGVNYCSGCGQAVKWE